MTSFPHAALWLFALGRGCSSPPPDAVSVEKEPFHRPVFTNSEVQVLDVVIPPKRSTLFHSHVHDLLGLTIASAPSKNQVQGQEESLETADPVGEVWYEPFPTASTHRVENLGTTPIHYVVFQLLGKAPDSDANASAWPTSAAGKVVFANARARVVRIDLAPGEESTDHEHPTGSGLLLLTGGRLVEDAGRARQLPEPGFVRWRDSSPHHTLRNAGDTPVQVFEFEIRN